MLLSNRSTVWPREIPLSRGQSKSLLSKKSRRRRLRLKPLRPLSQKLVGRNPGFGEALQKRDLHPPPDILPGTRGSKSLKQRGHLHARSFAQMLLGHMKDNPGLQKRVLLTSLPKKSFPWASNSECSMGMLFASPTLKLGGWWMALGGRFLQARFSPMPP